MATQTEIHNWHLLLGMLLPANGDLRTKVFETLDVSLCPVAGVRELLVAIRDQDSDLAKRSAAKMGLQVTGSLPDALLTFLTQRQRSAQLKRLGAELRMTEVVFPGNQAKITHLLKEIEKWDGSGKRHMDKK